MAKRKKTSKPAKRPIASLAVVPPPVPETFYSVSTWDHDAEDWTPRYPRVRKWQIREVLRGLYAEGWDVVTILVEKLDRVPASEEAIWT